MNDFLFRNLIKINIRICFFSELNYSVTKSNMVIVEYHNILNQIFISLLFIY